MKKNISIFIVLIILFYISGCSNNSGSKVSVKGNAEILRNGKKITIKTGSEISQNDEIKVHENSQVDIIVGKDDVIRVKPNTEIKMTKLETAKQSSQVSVTLKSGKIIAKLNTFKDTKSNFEINSQAAVCGVRGTQFSIESSSDLDEINVIKGEITVSSSGKEISLAENQKTTVRPGRPPMEPTQILQTVKPFLNLEVAMMRPDLTADAAKTTMAVFDIKTIQRAIDYYETANGKLPQSLNDATSSISDPWGTPLVYYINENGSGYTLFSAGPDSIIGSSDDIQLKR